VFLLQKSTKFLPISVDERYVFGQDKPETNFIYQGN